MSGASEPALTAVNLLCEPAKVRQDGSLAGARVKDRASGPTLRQASLKAAYVSCAELGRARKWVGGILTLH